jgi:acetyl-CoA carboxylase biotin carboxyl carrier protein
MTLQEIQDLIKLLNKSNVAEYKMKQGDFELTIRTGLYVEAKTPPPPPPTPQVLPMAPVATVAAPAIAQVPNIQAPPPPAASKEKEKPAEKAEAATKDENLLAIKSPMVGTFYRSSNPEKPAFVEIGQKVKKGQVVCIIEAMKLFNEIESEVSGTIVKVMVDNERPVEYDQVLFLVEPD